MFFVRVVNVVRVVISVQELILGDSTREAVQFNQLVPVVEVKIVRIAALSTLRYVSHLRNEVWRFHNLLFTTLEYICIVSKLCRTSF